MPVLIRRGQQSRKIRFGSMGSGAGGLRQAFSSDAVALLSARQSERTASGMDAGMDQPRVMEH